jgi:hypothetical protein
MRQPAAGRQNLSGKRVGTADAKNAQDDTTERIKPCIKVSARRIRRQATPAPAGAAAIIAAPAHKAFGQDGEPYLLYGKRLIGSKI